MNDGPDRVIELDLGVVPEAAVSGGLLLQTDTTARLLFNATRDGSDGRRVEAGVAVFTFERPILTRFGLPNDEAQPGHPILGKTEAGYGIFEVLDSTWLRKVEAQNRVAFPDSSFHGWRYFIVTMHDSTFECLAKDVRLSVHEGPFEEVFRSVGASALEE